MKRKWITLTMMGLMMVGAFGCGKKEEEATTEVTEATTEEVTTEDLHPGMTYNELTGEWSEEYVSRRPMAVMINNLKEALPSSSTRKADIIYECMVEGGITRIMPIFSNYDDLEKIGSVRSARHYYINIANEYDAIYVCYGQSKPAEKILNKGAIDAVNGINYEVAFYRDNDRVAPHNAYTTSELITKAIADKGFDTGYGEDHEKALSFNEQETELADGQDAKTVHVNFSTYSKPYFIYNEETKSYDRYEYDAPQVDDQEEEGNNILTFKNVIIQQSSYECINPENDLQELTQVGEGKGYYCTDGKAIPITWKKENNASKTKYYTEGGEELLLNPGKTWISIIGNGENAGVTFE